MRKVALLLFGCVLLLLPSCAAPESGDDDKAVRVFFQISADTEIYGIYCEYALNGETSGGQIVSYTPEMDEPFQAGETIGIRFTSGDFPEGSEPSTLDMDIFAVLKNQEELYLSTVSKYDVQYGDRFAYTLSGSLQEGFRLDETKDNSIL